MTVARPVRLGVAIALGLVLAAALGAENSAAGASSIAEDFDPESCNREGEAKTASVSSGVPLAPPKWVAPETPAPTAETNPSPPSSPTAAPASRRLESAAVGAPEEVGGGGLLAWEKGVRDKVKCWFTALPDANKFTLANCMGALALHMGSKLDMMFGGAPKQAAQGAGECEWVSEGELALPELPAFPDFTWNGFGVPPIPRLLPSWEHLHSLAPVGGEGYTAAALEQYIAGAREQYTAAVLELEQRAADAQPETAQQLADAQQQLAEASWTPFALGAGVGLSAGAAVSLGVLAMRRRLGGTLRVRRAQTHVEKPSR